MTLKEKKSLRKAKAIKLLVDTGEYSPAYGLLEADRLNDEGLLLDVDYEPLAEYLEELIERPITAEEEETEETDEGAEGLDE